MTDRSDILFVCHANLCRSPMAELLLRHAIGGAEVRVGSAGTHAWEDLPAHPLTARVLQEHGADPGGFRSRRLTAGLIDGAGLVLTATRQQRAACVALRPAAVRRAFTIKQFGRYASAAAQAVPDDGTPPERLRRLLDQVPLIRGERPVTHAEEDDLPDPVNQPIDAFRRCAAELQRMVDAIAAVIAPTPRAWPTPCPQDSRRS
ncbi:arsenate reductase/protein-tyrosine-phosphatase family protein [Actinoplanes aureus]|uniref:Low molecular weight phosphatase family protein n=1 Tax=Actinoplanes aureus TaxID=2792083 RepID=A0A931FWH6_9ACTN|nr:low molecular weight phosphatase family protein [Actinoplanes aureus]MBG0562453.1 low molecular weight phosphatase family protein [Actinoplanes aureus]